MFDQEFKEKLQKAILNKDVQYSISRRDRNENLYDLFVMMGNCAYRIASYNTKTDRLIIPFVTLCIPPNDIIKQFIKIANSRLKEIK